MEWVDNHGRQYRVYRGGGGIISNAPPPPSRFWGCMIIHWKWPFFMWALRRYVDFFVVVVVVACLLVIDIGDALYEDTPTPVSDPKMLRREKSVSFFRTCATFEAGGGSKKKKMWVPPPLPPPPPPPHGLVRIDAYHMPIIILLKKQWQAHGNVFWRGRWGRRVLTSQKVGLLRLRGCWWSGDKPPPPQKKKGGGSSHQNYCLFSTFYNHCWVNPKFPGGYPGVRPPGTPGTQRPGSLV